MDVMKKLLLALAIISTSSFVLANDEVFDDQKNALNVEVKTYDSKKYCYYADQEYSKGAVMKQDTSIKVCEVGSEGTLIWVNQ
ncbi:DUF1496 domain-containing protein [Pseudoalteromonas piscicida]|uniref:DUF1496 domain-containing protein n=1 Tax=Pseudoalteromonas piscicida TaxID=43662 RepID=UPI00309F8C42